MGDASRADLGAFIDAGAARPFAWGVHDCALWLADWGLALTGVDPAEHLRGRYSTRRGCTRILARHGGLIEVVSGCARSIGMGEVHDLSAAPAGAVGVIGVIDERGVQDAAGGISVGGGRWAALGVRGVSVGRAAAFAAWSF